MLRNLPSSALKELVKLSERREALIAQLQEFDRQMVEVQSRFGIPSQEDNTSAVITVSRPGGKSDRRRQTKRGALKEKILDVLKRSGRKGATISELSAKIGVPAANLYVWFNGTGKRVPGIKKIGVARYRLR